MGRVSVVRVAVIGTGFGARVVAPAFDVTSGCRVVDVVSARDEPAVRALVRRPEVDLVTVHSPPFLHADHVRLALGAGKAVLCDKPFARDPDEAAALVREAAACGAVDLVNFEFRFEPARVLLRDLVRAGRLGTVEHVVWTHWSAGSRVPLRRFGWLFDAARGGGWIGAWASHAVDTLRFCFGEIGDVWALPRTTIAERPDADGVMRHCTAEDGVTAVLRINSGATVTIDSTFAASASLAPRLVVVGSDATVEIVGDRTATLRHGTESERLTVDGAGAAGDPHDLAMRRSAAAVRDAVVAGTAAGTDLARFADGWACDVVLAALRRGPHV
jgi:predicted dehydrogenase